MRNFSCSRARTARALAVRRERQDEAWRMLLALLTAIVALAVFQVPASRAEGPITVATVPADSERARARSAGSGVASGERVRVVVRSNEIASIGSEVNARITYLPPREGDRIRKGDLIVEFDCRKIVAELDAARAAFKAHRASYVSQLRMMRYAAAGTLSVEQARYEMERTEAETRSLEAKCAGCKVVAPFDGRVVEKMAQVHEIAQPNQPLIKIINDGKLELVLMVPSAWLSGIAEGTRFKVEVDESGTSLEARVVQSTGLIDPVSQSARLIGELVGPAPGVQAGMSGTAVFALEGVHR